MINYFSPIFNKNLKTNLIDSHQIIETFNQLKCDPNEDEIIFTLTWCKFVSLIEVLQKVQNQTVYIKQIAIANCHPIKIPQLYKVLRRVTTQDKINLINQCNESLLEDLTQEFVNAPTSPEDDRAWILTLVERSRDLVELEKIMIIVWEKFGKISAAVRTKIIEKCTFNSPVYIITRFIEPLNFEEINILYNKCLPSKIPELFKIIQHKNLALENCLSTEIFKLVKLIFPLSDEDKNKAFSRCAPGHVHLLFSVISENATQNDRIMALTKCDPNIIPNLVTQLIEKINKPEIDLAFERCQPLYIFKLFGYLFKKKSLEQSHFILALEKCHSSQIPFLFDEFKDEKLQVLAFERCSAEKIPALFNNFEKKFKSQYGELAMQKCAGDMILELFKMLPYQTNLKEIAIKRCDPDLIHNLVHMMNNPTIPERNCALNYCAPRRIPSLIKILKNISVAEYKLALQRCDPIDIPKMVDLNKDTLTVTFDILARCSPLAIPHLFFKYKKYDVELVEEAFRKCDPSVMLDFFANIFSTTNRNIIRKRVIQQCNPNDLEILLTQLIDDVTNEEYIEAFTRAPKLSLFKMIKTPTEDNILNMMHHVIPIRVPEFWTLVKNNKSTDNDFKDALIAHCDETLIHKLFFDMAPSLTNQQRHNFFVRADSSIIDQISSYYNDNLTDAEINILIEKSSEQIYVKLGKYILPKIKNDLTRRILFLRKTNFMALSQYTSHFIKPTNEEINAALSQPSIDYNATRKALALISSIFPYICNNTEYRKRLITIITPYNIQYFNSTYEQVYLLFGTNANADEINLLITPTQEEERLRANFVREI